MTRRQFSGIFFAAVLAVFSAGNSPGAVIPVHADGDYVTSVVYKLNGTTLTPGSDGTYTVEDGTKYEIDVTFAESEGNQFPTPTFTYQLPSGITPVATSGSMDIVFDTGSGSITYSGNTYSIDSNGLVTVNWNTSDTEGYAAFLNSTNVSFTLIFTGVFNNTNNSLVFSSSVKNNVTISDTAAVTVEKTASAYDASTNTVTYTATVTGQTGTSTNVVVTDTLSGTALTLDTSSISISKSPDTAEDPVQTSVSEDGFVYTIPVVAAGDVYTFTYTASVDVDGITGTGTASQTENDISVVSDENTTPVTDTTDLAGDIDYTDISKDAVLVSETDNQALVKWTVTYGDADVAASLAGFTLTDTLAWLSDRLSFDVNGVAGDAYNGNDPGLIITATTTTSSGTSETTTYVSWSDLNVTSSSQSWSWTIPDDAVGNTVYTIVYYTVYDTTDLVTRAYLSNTVNDGHNHSATDGVAIGTTDIGITKSLSDISYTDYTATWTLTLTVPAAGLTDAYLIDEYPNKQIDGVTYYDTLYYDDTAGAYAVTVSGLLDGESYTLDTTNTNHLRIDFSSNYTDTDGTAYELMPSSASRTITVTIVTNINQEWLAAAASSSSVNYRTHINKATFSGNSQSVTARDRFYTNPSGVSKSASKSGYPFGYYASPYDSSAYFITTSTADSDLPVWKFRITLSGVYGDITVTDEFDTDLFEIVPETAELTDNRRVIGYSTWNGKYSYVDVEGNSSKATVTSIDTGATFYIASEDMPKYNNDADLYYPTYFIDYYIRVKDEEALQELREICAEEGTDLTATLTNSVTYDRNVASVSYYYTYEGVTKEIVNDAYEGDDGYTYADFEIVLNPTAADLDPDSDTLEASDTWSDSLAVMADSFVFTDADGNDISDSVVYDISGHTATFTIPDATAVTVTYSARILGTGSIEYSNTATLMGYIAGDSSTTTVSSTGSGSGSLFRIYLLKYETGNLNQTLSGAVFSLYRLDLLGNKVPVTDSNGNIVTVTTDEEGKATLYGSLTDDGWALYENVQYYLHEETAPDGYYTLDEDIPFQVNSSTQDWDNYLYINGDTILIPNEECAEITFTKVWDDGSDRYGDRPGSDEFASWLHLYQTVDGVTTEVTDYTIQITENGNSWLVRFTDLPIIDGTYSVQEVIPDDSTYTADYGSDDTEYVTDGGTLTNVSHHVTTSTVLQTRIVPDTADSRAE